MSSDFCLDCGALLASYKNECPVCGFDNTFEQYEDFQIDDVFIEHFNESFDDEEEESEEAFC